jgi:hypothetical protein
MLSIREFLGLILCYEIDCTNCVFLWFPLNSPSQILLYYVKIGRNHVFPYSSLLIFYYHSTL